MKVFLFDMDGVLLESRGYHLALQETVRRTAMALGVGDFTISPDTIAAFEAGGITSEWDEAAFCAASLLETVWQDEPERGLPDSLAKPGSIRPGQYRAPNFYDLALKLSTPDMLRFHPLERAERFFLEENRHSPSQERILHALLLGARLAKISITHRTFQELVLGSAEYACTYDLPAELDCASYLLKYDRSNLSPTDRIQLMNWIVNPGHAAAVITSRPSRPPIGIFSTEEAELGAKLVGLDGIPILGWGGICWLGYQRNTNPQVFLKPSPVHALASLRMATGESQESSLTAGFDLVETGLATPEWQRMDGAIVNIFEDTPSGIRSLRTAQNVLKRAGIHIETNFIGIAQNPVKVRALEANGAHVFHSLAQALDLSLQ